tara:strand:- start:4100 stop:4924 length:825 start_codon:yes stop_codon:yes gene_type:complete
MKIKHNKKRNTAFLFEVLTRALTKSLVENTGAQTRRIKKIIKEYFRPASALYKELDCYRAFSESEAMDTYTAEKLIFTAKLSHDAINPKKIFSEQSDLIRRINHEIGPEAFNTFIPNYKSYATLAQIFGNKLPVKTRVLLEQNILKTLTQKRTDSDELTPVDTLVVQTFAERFNTQYQVLLPEQRQILSKYVLSFGPNDADFRFYLTEELRRLVNTVEASLEMEEVKLDHHMLSSTQRILEVLRGYRVTNIDDGDLLRILKIQHLSHEYSHDAN